MRAQPFPHPCLCGVLPRPTLLLGPAPAPPLSSPDSRRGRGGLDGLGSGQRNDRVTEGEARVV